MTTNQLQILKDFINSCIFIHDDPDSTSGVDWDEHGTNPFLLGCDVCVVDSIDGFGHQYLEYYQALGILPSHLIIPYHSSQYLVENLLSDPKALLHLTQAVSNKSLNLSTFYPYRHQKYLELIEALKKTDHSPKCFPPQDAFYFLNNKTKSRQLLENSDLPVPEGTICYSPMDLFGFYAKVEARYPNLIIKEDHWISHIVHSTKEIEHIVRSLKFPILVEVLYPVKASPISHNLVWKGQSHHLFIVLQSVRNHKHAGNTIPLNISHEYVSQIERYSHQFLSLLHDFDGLVGIDFIITDQGELLVVDVNPRFNSSTYPFFFLINQGFDLNKTFAKYGFTHCKLKNLEVIFRQTDFEAFSLETREGILMYTPTFSRDEQMVTKVSYLCVAKTQNKLEQLENQILRKVSARNR